MHTIDIIINKVDKVINKISLTMLITLSCKSHSNLLHLLSTNKNDMKIKVNRNEQIEIKPTDTLVFTDANNNDFRISFDRFGVLTINKYSDNDSTMSIIPNVSNQIQIA